MKANHEHKEQEDAIQKLKELAEGIRTCMFCTDIYEMPFKTRPMGTQQVDEEGNIWFFSADDSLKNIEIKNNPNVQLLYAKPGDAKYLSVSGTATIITDRAKIDELWNPIAKAWFPEGKNDPNLSLIRVQPSSAHYWESEYGKMITLAAIAIAAITGKPMNEGVEGSLKI